jgi:hypothetical protein
MSQNGNTQNNLSIRKKDLVNSKINSTFYSNLEFAHLSSGGETVIDFNSLNLPSEAISLEGFQNPTVAALVNAKITQNKGNVKLHSSLRGELQRFTEFYIREDSKIRLTFETAENEIITGMINNVIRTTPSIIDVKKISFTGTLLEGATDIVIGAEYNINANPSSQLGDIVVYRWKGNAAPRLMVRCEGNDIGNDGNYIEKLNAIEFKEVGRADGENIAIFSPNCVPTTFQNSFQTDLETIGGQVDIISQFLQDVHSLPTNIFQVAANQLDLRAFGQKLSQIFGVIFGSITIPSSFATKIQSYFSFSKAIGKTLDFDTVAGSNLTVDVNSVEGDLSISGGGIEITRNGRYKIKVMAEVFGNFEGIAFGYNVNGTVFMGDAQTVSPNASGTREQTQDNFLTNLQAGQIVKPVYFCANVRGWRVGRIHIEEY